MRDKKYLKSLLEYNAWANSVLYKKVMELPSEEIMKERKTSLQSIFVSLNHLLAVDQIWLAHMQGLKHNIKVLRETVHEDMTTLWKARQDMEITLLDYLQSLTEDGLEEVIDYELIGGNQGSLSRAMCLTHLVLHGSYHRGWIADMFGQAETQPALIDIPVYERTIRGNGSVELP